MSLSSGDANHVTSEQHDFCGIDQFTRSPFEPHVFLQLPELSAMAKHACATADNNDVIPLAMHLDNTRPNSPIEDVLRMTVLARTKRRSFRIEQDRARNGRIH